MVPSLAVLDPSRVRRALEGDPHALREFVDALTPVIQARVARGLLRNRAERAGRDVQQEVEDLTQDVFAALFAQGGRTLRAWDPARGLSLANFVGLVAERQVASTLRSGRRNPWRDVPGELDEIEARTEPVPGAEPQLGSKQALEQLLVRMRESLSPRGLELFERLYVDEESVEDVAASMKMTRDAIYTWRGRVGGLLRRFAQEMVAESGDRALDPAAASRNPEGSSDG